VPNDKAGKLNRLLELLGGAGGDGGDITELCAAITSRKNKEQALPFSAVPYAERLVVVPHCLRATGACKAEEKSAFYVCARCRACKIADIVEKAEELGYLGVKILKGGSAVSAMLREVKPRAVLGVACSFEGALGALECEKQGIAVQFVALARDGCADTDVDVQEVLQALEFRQL
jgi:hypothetical protein